MMHSVLSSLNKVNRPKVISEKYRIPLGEMNTVNDYNLFKTEALKTIRPILLRRHEFEGHLFTVNPPSHTLISCFDVSGCLGVPALFLQRKC